jgi:hypothetical protein
MNVAFAVLVAGLCCSTARAEDWTTSDGKVYQNVTVVKSAPDAVTILYRDGGALVPLAKLPANLQQRFHYDPAKAKIAADERVKADATSAQAKKLQNARQAKDKAEQKTIADRKKAESRSSPASEPAILEPNNHPDGILGKPR